jgi:DNA-binding beta-propeller fold protein YncE
MLNRNSFSVGLSVCLTLVASSPARAQIVVSANDGKAVLVDGVNTVPRPTPPDTVTILDANVLPPRVVAELPVPNSVVGPPQNVAITPNGALALVASATRIDPADATRIVPDDRVTVIALGGTPRVVGTVRTGAGANGIGINPGGTLALVANRNEGTVSVLSINGQLVTPIAKIDLAAPDSLPSQAVFAPDGATAFVTRNGDSLISVFSVAGTTVTNTKRDIGAGYKPYGMEITPDGALGIVASTGVGTTGGTDVVSVIALKNGPPRTVDQIAVGITPEAVAISPDGRFVAVTVMNGTNQPASSFFHAPNGRLRLFRIEKQTIVPVTEAPVGKWCQGMAWTKDSQAVLVQCMVEKEISVFRFDGRTLTRAGAVKVSGGPAGIRAVGR